MKQHQQWATITQAIHSELISIYSNITTLAKITIPLNRCVISFSANATTPDTPICDKACIQSKIHITFFTTTECALLALTYSSVYEWKTNSVYIVHAILKILATLLRLTKLLPTLGISSYNLTVLKSGSTHLDPSEPIGTDGGNFAFRIVFCSVDITTTNTEPNIEIPQPCDNALRSHEPTVRICPNCAKVLGFIITGGKIILFHGWSARNLCAVHYNSDPWYCTWVCYLLIAWNRVVLEKLIGSQLVKIFPLLYETRRSLPHSQVPASCPYPELAWYSPCPHIPLPEGSS